jgi:NADH dehydrogenase
MAWNVVVAGGGFGGFYAARRLERVLPHQSARVTLVSEVNFLLYTPLLPGAASGTLEPRHVVVPLREELHRTNIRLAKVTGLDPDARRLEFRTALGKDESIGYDQLILALGSVSRVLPIPGLAEHGLGFKTISEAIALRNRALTNLEIAESLDDPEQRRPYLTFVFVGAGYAGVEGIAELQDFVADVIARYPRSRLDGTRWVLVEAEERIMPEIPPSLAEFTTTELRARGIEVQTNTRVNSVEEAAVELSSGERIPTRTLCWTAGVKPPAVSRELGLPLTPQGRIDCDEYTLRKFKYKTLGVFVDLGRNEAVAVMLGLRLTGFPAWFAARTYHLISMPGLGRRARLMVDWTVGLVFGRSSSELGQLGHPPDLKGYLDNPPRTEPAAHETSSH